MTEVAVTVVAVTVAVAVVALVQTVAHVPPSSHHQSSKAVEPYQHPLPPYHLLLKRHLKCQCCKLSSAFQTVSLFSKEGHESTCHSLGQSSYIIINN